ncbi:MAG TPA: pyruvate, phosphate dikinase [Planctomycetota bacterium]|nr:pyruvate, phosphate dikinase [Planctomycetota bacterium]
MRAFYFFGSGKADGTADMKDILGGKGAGLAEMSKARIPVPPGFTLATFVCMDYYKNGRKTAKSIDVEQKQYLAQLEKAAGKKLGDPRNPLLVSVRSGAKVSMPGMMDTILNLGLNDATVEGLASMTKNPRFAYDCYRRFIMMFSDVVFDVPKGEFEEHFHKRKQERGVHSDTELSADDLKELSVVFKDHFRSRANREFPQDTWEQLCLARDAVFKSWQNPRANSYRKMNKIPDEMGTAVNVQAMVFGNSGDKSGTGVGFTRDPSTGENKFYGEFLINAQGEDVVAGVRTPQPIAQLKQIMPKAYDQLHKITKDLEKHYRDIQDFEFTVEDEQLYMLQTRSGKRTGHAAVRIAVEMVKEKLITKEEAILRVDPMQLNQLLHPIFDPVERKKIGSIAKGLNASPGAAAGKAAFTAEKAVEMAAKGERVLLVRAETSPDDIEGMAAAKGVLTATGGMTSHAAVVGRQMGKPSVVGCSAIKVDEHGGRFSVGSTTISEGDYVSIDGTTGEVFVGDVPTRDSDILQILAGKMQASESETFQYFDTFMKWADEVRTLKVRANADIPRDAKAAMALGAEGIGLCRTEHMFFAPDRLPVVQRMILATTEEDRKAALKELLPFQRADFFGLFDVMKGKPVTIRTLDPPLHEFLPKREELMVDVALGKNKEENEKLLKRVNELHEFNPMMGLRGCRLGIVFPEITAMQAEAIFEAALDVGNVIPEVMIPLVGTVQELKNQKDIVVKVAEEVFKRRGKKLKYLVGTMIEVPRAAIVADQIATEAEFFSFGTNDLTQMTFGYSRDDAGKFLLPYVDKKILPIDPFVSIDQVGVGGLVKGAVEKGRAVRDGMKIGVCGEHGGDPDSVIFFHGAGLDYVSCSPYRLPIARLAAAHAVLRAKSKGKPKKRGKK